MEPFEWLLLGAGLAIGGVLGANSKGVMRSAARGYITVGEKTREWSGNMREDLQDAIEEARYDREEAEYEAAREQNPREKPKTKMTTRKTPATTRKTPATTSARTGQRAGSPGRPRRNAAGSSTDTKETTDTKPAAS